MRWLICISLIVGAKHTQETWNKLREAYTAAMRRRRTKSGAAAEHHEPWRLERQMKWLDEYSHQRK